MNKLYLLLMTVMLTTSTALPSFAQNNQQNPNFHGRSDLEPMLQPFYHGVASGDPLPDAVIIWTRITVDQPGPVDVSWRMATDTNFANIVASGSVTTDENKDYTVKVDVTGLQPDTWYYYEFEHNWHKSIIGRTKTAPQGGVDSLRFAVVSCSDYENGYFNAYKAIAERNDVDAVFHLGDYIYEYGAGSSIGRDHEPPHEIITLDDYRVRYSHYRLDPDLRKLHQNYPFVHVYDDHESANNSWYGGAENHTPGDEGDWFDRKAYALQAHEEWLPIRKPDPNDSEKIYRKISYGDLVNFYMIDTRLYGRDEQGSGPDSTRRMLGQQQLNWLANELTTSTAQWNVIGQQVMMAPLQIFGVNFNNDQWDGYPKERENVYNTILNNNVDNIVVLTGDIHTSWGNDLPLDTYDNNNPDSILGSVGVEFVTTSITSQASPVPLPVSLIQTANPHIHYAQLTKKGYVILDINSSRTQADWNYVSTITDQSFTEEVGASWFVNDQETFLREAGGPVDTATHSQPLAPLWPNHNVGLEEQKPVAELVGVYPNPFYTDLLIQFQLFEGQENVQIELRDISGKLIYGETFSQVPGGLHYYKVDGSDLAGGIYIFSLKTDEALLQRRVVKAN